METRLVGKNPPPDAHVVGRGWEHQRIDGGPDRRYAVNREVLNVQFSAVHLTSRSGLNAWLISSRIRAR